MIDLNNRQVIVFRDPVADAAVAFGHRYNSRQTFGSSEAVSPLAAPHSSIIVGDLLP